MYTTVKGLTEKRTPTTYNNRKLNYTIIKSDITLTTLFIRQYNQMGRFSTDANKEYTRSLQTRDDDSWGGDRCFRGWGHYMRAQRSTDSIYIMMLQRGDVNVPNLTEKQRLHIQIYALCLFLQLLLS